MKRPAARLHWIIWPVLALALLGLIVPRLWPEPPPRPTADQPVAPSLTPPASAGVTAAPLTPTAGATAVPPQPVEQPVIQIPMGGRLADQSAEISGLAWYGDYLMLLPQYPRHATGGNEGYIYALRKADILDFLDGKTKGPLEPLAVRFDAYGIRDQMRNFQGFESIGFSGDRVYVTIEAGAGTNMMGYLASGQVMPDLSKIVLDSKKLVSIQPQAAMDNKADEALLVLDDRILTFFEVNGAAFNPHPEVHVFSLDLQALGTLPSVSLEYRLTDAAREPGTNRFWVINQFFLADLELLPKADPLAEAFGKGPTHARLPQVERLVEMKFDPTGVTLAGTAPVQLQLATFETRNWEGLALLDNRGFLVATDKYPSTILAFVPRP
ncbi:MAG: hypothetical protein ACM3QS_18825 [Bacteroidota bacterium]